MNSPPAFPSHWQVSGGKLVAETRGSRIWQVRRSDGAPCIVKALKPFEDFEDELRGAWFLDWRRGVGAVRLLGRDGKMMLIEFAGERHLSAEIDARGDEAATEIAADVLAALHSPSNEAPPPQLQPLADRFASLFAKAEADRRAGLTGLYVEAATVAQRILAEPSDQRPLHGDLHHDNILHGPRGWLAIDPKGVFGDPCFDAANLFYNPLGRDALCRDPRRIASMARIISARLGRPQTAILDHAFAYGCLSASWHAEDANDVEEARTLSIALAIRQMRASMS